MSSEDPATRGGHDGAIGDKDAEIARLTEALAAQRRSHANALAEKDEQISALHVHYQNALAGRDHTIVAMRRDYEAILAELRSREEYPVRDQEIGDGEATEEDETDDEKWYLQGFEEEGEPQAQIVYSEKQDEPTAAQPEDETDQARWNWVAVCAFLALAFAGQFQ
jgi:hypothetical protein